MGLFQEYLDSKGKIAKPVVDVSGDQIDPKTPPNAPPKGGKPYVAKGADQDGKKKGFGDMGDKELEYEPATTKDNKGHAPAKIPTVEQIELATLLADAMMQDGTVVETVIDHLSQRGLLGVLVAEMLQHRDSYDHIAEVMSHKEYGPTTRECLVRAWNKVQNEEVASPFPQA